MSEDIKVSIVMPVFNHGKYIEQAIESVLMQKVNFKYELLIGEDCSTDNSLELIKKYEKYEQVKIFAREKNMHNDKVKNTHDLLFRSAGEYVVVLEGDDYWTDPEKLQTQVDFLDNNPDYIACAHGFEVVNQDGEVYHDEAFSRQFFQNNPYDKSVIEKGLMLSHTNALMYRNIYITEEFDKRLITDYAITKDYAVTTYLVLNGKMHFIPKVMSHYRKVVNKASSSYSAQMEINNKRDEVFYGTLGFEKFLNEKYEINLYAKKKATYASAVFKWNRDRNKTNFKVVKNIIKMSGEPFKYTWWFVYLLISRFILNHTGRRDQMVKF